MARGQERQACRFCCRRYARQYGHEGCRRGCQTGRPGEVLFFFLSSSSTCNHRVRRNNNTVFVVAASPAGAIRLSSLEAADSRADKAAESAPASSVHGTEDIKRRKDGTKQTELPRGAPMMWREERDALPRCHAASVPRSSGVGAMAFVTNRDGGGGGVWVVPGRGNLRLH